MHAHPNSEKRLVDSRIAEIAANHVGLAQWPISASPEKGRALDIAWEQAD